MEPVVAERVRRLGRSLSSERVVRAAATAVARLLLLIEGSFGEKEDRFALTTAFLEVTTSLGDEEERTGEGGAERRVALDPGLGAIRVPRLSCVLGEVCAFLGIGGRSLRVRRSP